MGKIYVLGIVGIGPIIGLRDCDGLRLDRRESHGMSERKDGSKWRPMKVNEGADVVRPSSFPQDSGPGQTVYGRVLSFTWTKNPLVGQVLPPPIWEGFCYRL